MKFTVYFVFVLAFLIQCTGGEAILADADLGSLQQIPVDITAVPVDASGQNSKSDIACEDSSFSSYIQLSADKKFVCFSYSFFPDGTDTNFEKKTVSIPCSFLSMDAGDVDIQLTAPTEQQCEPYVLHFDKDAAFTMRHIITSVESQMFTDLFEFDVTPDGVKDSTDETLLSSSRGKFEDFYDLVLERRQE